jgi:mRNA interferase HigB
MQCVGVRNAKLIHNAMKKHASARKPLLQWLRLVQAVQWQSIVDARCSWPTADAIKDTPFTCFNVVGNNFRLIAVVSYERQAIVVEALLTDAEYTKKYT